MYGLVELYLKMNYQKRLFGPNRPWAPKTIWKTVTCVFKDKRERKVISAISKVL